MFIITRTLRDVDVDVDAAVAVAAVHCAWEFHAWNAHT